MVKPNSTLNVPPAVRRYMQELELILKQVRGVSPEEALADAREFLMADYEALLRSGEQPDEETHYRWIEDHFGTPEQVARQYATQVDPPPPPAVPGLAPGWRICCKHCGRSSPLAATGAIRIGAYSHHKYVYRYCSTCGRWRWCRVIQDLNDTNLTEQLCNNISPEELRAQMHLPTVNLVLMIVLIVGIVLGINALVWLIILTCTNLFARA